MTGLAQITKIAGSINSHNFSDGGISLECLELEITSGIQLADVLKTAREQSIFVFRGPHKSRPKKLKSWFQSITENAPGKRLQAVFLNFNKMNKITEHVKGDQVLSVETGMSLSELNTYLSNHGQWLPVEYLSENVTLADVIDSGNGGYLEPFSGGVKNLVLGMELGLASGEVIKTGGKIVKNVTGYDLSKLFTGSHSWLAVPYLVHLRLYSKPEKESTFIISGSKPQELVALAAGLRATGLPAYAIETIDSRLLKHCASVSTDPVLATDINSLMHAVGGNDSVLIVSTRGHKHVADEVSRALREVIEKTGLKISDVPQALANRMQRLCSEIFEQSATEFAELSLSGSAMTYFFETFWQQHGKPFWSARPASGRLRIGFADDPNSNLLKEFLNSLNGFAALVNKDGWQPITVAHQSEYFELVVRRLAQEANTTDASGAVIARLKSKYDPSGVLNPLLSFLP